MKIQTMKELEAEMRAVARGEREAPRDAASPSIESAGALIRRIEACCARSGITGRSPLPNWPD
jgi:hypothetical protein